MDSVVERYSDPLILIPMAAMFLIVFTCVWSALGKLPMFEERPRLVVALCVAFLGIYGMDQAIMLHVIERYTALAVAILVGLASLVLSAWLKLANRTRNGSGRGDDD